MKIHILYPFKEGPWGGANQFLKAIKVYFIKKSCYENNPKKADIIIFNGSPSSELGLIIKELYKLKKGNPKLLIFIRLDGPIFLIRDNDLEIDKVFFSSQIMADILSANKECETGTLEMKGGDRPLIKLTFNVDDYNAIYFLQPRVSQ